MKAAVSKTARPGRASWVRIPGPPPHAAVRYQRGSAARTGRATASHAEGWEFNSPRIHQTGLSSSGPGLLAFNEPDAGSNPAGPAKNFAWRPGWLRDLISPATRDRYPATRPRDYPGFDRINIRRLFGWSTGDFRSRFRPFDVSGVLGPENFARLTSTAPQQLAGQSRRGRDVQRRRRCWL